MILNIVLAIIHIILSSVFFYFYVSKKVELPPYAFPAFFITSIVACLLIMLYSIDCKNRFGEEHKNKWMFIILEKFGMYSESK